MITVSTASAESYFKSSKKTFENKDKASTEHIFSIPSGKEISGGGKLIVELTGDFDKSYEYAKIYIDGEYVGKVRGGAAKCKTSLSENISFTESQAKKWFSDGSATVRVKNSNYVSGCSSYSRKHNIALKINDIRDTFSSVSLKKIALSCPSSVDEDKSIDCTVTRFLTDGSSSVITNDTQLSIEQTNAATISRYGKVTAGKVDDDDPFIVKAGYTYNGKTKIDYSSITIKNYRDPKGQLTEIPAEQPLDVDPVTGGIRSYNEKIVTITSRYRNSKININGNDEWIVKLSPPNNYFYLCEKDRPTYCLNVVYGDSKLRSSEVSIENRKYFQWLFFDSGDYKKITNIGRGVYVHNRNTNPEVEIIGFDPLIYDWKIEKVTCDNCNTGGGTYLSGNGTFSDPFIVDAVSLAGMGIVDCSKDNGCGGLNPEETVCFQDKWLLNYKLTGNTGIELWGSNKCDTRWITTFSLTGENVFYTGVLKSKIDGNYYKTGGGLNSDGNSSYYHSPMIYTPNQCSVKGYGSNLNSGDAAVLYDLTNCRQCLGDECNSTNLKKMTVELTPIAKYITDEINTNLSSDVVKLMMNYNNYSCNQESSILRIVCNSAKNDLKTLAKVKFASLVMQNAKWDHKKEIGEKFITKRGIKVSNYNGIYDVTYQSWHKMGAYVYNYDIWSNIHYGYIGRASGFTIEELSDGADLAQVYTNAKTIYNNDANLETLFNGDDPLDKAAIIIGYTLYDIDKNKVDINNLMKLVFLKRESLNRRKDEFLY